MRKLTEQDIDAIIGTDVNGYTVVLVRVKLGQFIDSDHYGIAIGKSGNSDYATWQFHLEDEEPSFYWGHYFGKKKGAAALDFSTRD